MTVERFDTIVVGAGVAGLAAARLLAGAGQRVVLLEARERIGGRVHTERSGGRITDLGASWIHGIEHSALAETTAAFGMPTVEFTVGSYQAGGRPIAYYGPEGDRLDAQATAQFIADVALVDAHLADVIAAAAPATSYATVAEAAVARAAAEGAWPEDRGARVLEYLRHRSEEQYGADATMLDAHGLDDDAIEGDEVVFPEGYDTLASHLAAGLDVRLEHVVTAVTRRSGGSASSDSAGGVEVETDRGRFTASQAVVTVPVGVLQSGGIVFDPPLPEPIAEALAGLGMNAFEKVFLRFPERFWESDVYAIRRQGAAAAWWHSWYDLTALHGEPTLLTFAAGECAQQIRDWSDERIVASVLASLRELYGPAVPDPVHAQVTRWQQDPWAGGAYAYMTVGSRPEDHDLLATPIDGVLHLAGEATWTEDPATVTAALASGHRAAERILGRELPYSSLYGGN